MNSCDFQSKISNLLEFQETKTIAVNDLSSIPTEVLVDIISQLPLESVKALHVASREIQPITKFVLYTHTQKHLENILKNLLEDDDIKKNLKRKSDVAFPFLNISCKFLLFKEIVKDFPNGSEERCQALRDVISSLFQHMPWPDAAQKMESYTFYEDKFLPRQTIKNIFNSNVTCGYNIDCHINHSRFFILCLKMLKTNQIKPEYLYLNINGGDLNQKILKLCLKIIKKNQSINDVSFSFKHWKPVDLTRVLEAIINNEGIRKVCISDTRYDCIASQFWRIHQLNKKIDSHVTDTLGEAFFKNDYFWERQ